MQIEGVVADVVAVLQCDAMPHSRLAAYFFVAH